ncbi:MAG: hypothetical protein ABIR15_05905 [Chitinophagaceae bacterium]
MEQAINGSADKRTVVVNQLVYSYQAKPFVLVNTLGFIRAVLTEYTVSGINGEMYKLYKTTEHNWYDIEDANPGAGSSLLGLLKVEIDSKEKNGV